MSLARTIAAFDFIEAQIKALNIDPFVQSCLSQYLAVTFYAEMEERVAEIVTTQLQEFTNEPIGAYLASNIDKIIRRTPKSDIADLVASFGTEFKTAFNELISEIDVSRYANVITARHGVGHKQGSNITMADIQDGILVAEKILAALQTCFDKVAKKKATEIEQTAPAK